MNDGDLRRYADRNVETPITNFEAFSLVVKCVLGFGTLTMPLAFVTVGIVGGVLLTPIMSVILVYGVYLLVQCMVEASSRNNVGYMTMSEAMAFAFSEGPSCCPGLSKIVGVLVDFLLVLTHYGLNVVYIIFIAENFSSITATGWDPLHIRIIITFVGIFTIPIFLIRNFQWLYPMSLISNIMTYFGFAMILVELYHSEFFPDVDMFRSEISFMPMFIGFIMFSMSSVGVMVTIESKMAQPEKFLGWTGILNISAILIFVTNLSVGITYYILGDEMLVRLLDNLGPMYVCSKTAKLTLAVAVYFTIPLNGYVPVDIILNHFVLKDREASSPLRIEYIIRVVFVLISTIHAAALPVMMPIVKLIGAFTISFLNIIFPACMELCLMYNEANGKPKLMLLKDIVIIIMGILVFVCGLYSAVFDIMVEYTGMKIQGNLWSKLSEFDE